MKIHYPGQQGGPYGWGNFGASIVRELRKLDAYADSAAEAEAVLQPLADHDLNPATNLRGRRNLAVCFFESQLGPHARENATRYDTVFAGSTWCLDRMRERGITNGQLLIQGVDADVFRPAPPRALDGQIRVFSGGKFEWRKGQDLVIAGFKRYLDRHPAAHLVCSWWNPWPQLVQTIAQSPHIRIAGEGTTQEELFAHLLTHNGIGPDHFTILPKLDHSALAREMADTDFGVFPNRCEGGTNLVLMEYLACGRVAAANIGTGHRDIRQAIQVRIPYRETAEHWAESSPDDIAIAMESARAKNPGAVPAWKWSDAAKTILRALR